MRWEQALTSSSTYSNPYRHLFLRVQWTCVSGCATFEATKLPPNGFWDGGAGGRTFKLRALFPQPLGTASTATWRWATTCSTTPQGTAAGEPDCSADSGLNSTSIDNTITVARSDTANGITNPLYQGSGTFLLAMGSSGSVPGNRHLRTLSGIPFYWLGDTAWAAPVRAKFDAAATPNCSQASGWNTNDWKCYVDDRAARGFSVIQISVPQWWMKDPLTDAIGAKPFEDSASFPAWSKWNPAFWRGFEEKIQYANEKGLAVVIVGVMEPSYRYIAGDNPSFAQRYPPTEDAKTFARNLAARLAGNIVIPSPAFDTKPDGGARSDLMRAVGAELDAALPRHRIVNHFGGSTPVTMAGAWNDYQDFHNEAWLDFHLFQSGQCRNLPNGTQATPSQQLQNFTNRARHMPLDLRTFVWGKGAGNGESIYDFEGVLLEPGRTAPPNAHHYRPYRVRQTAYLSTLSGAFGYTLGVYGLWDWGRGDGGEPYQPRAPRDSVGLPSTLQIQHLANLFRSHRWWWLTPVPALIRNNSVEPDPNNLQFQHLQMVASRDLTRRSTLAYLPDNGEIRLQLSSALYPSFLSPRWSKRFHNPRTGGTPTPVTPTLEPGTTDVYRFLRPPCPLGQICDGQKGDRDWVLVLTDTAAGNPLWTPSPEAGHLQTWSEADPESQQWTIRGQLVDPNGQAMIEETALSLATSSPQRLSQAVCGAGGSFLVVWEAESLDAGGTGILGRLVNGSGVPIGEPFQINATGTDHHSEPIVTADATGHFVVVWSRSSSDAEATGVIVRRYSDQGVPLGNEVEVASGGAEIRSSPLVSAEPGGGFVVGWMSGDPEQGTSAILVQRFDPEARPLGTELAIEASSTAHLALERLEMDALGNFQATWQRLVDGESQGHFSTSFDRATETLAPASMVAEGWK